MNYKIVQFTEDHIKALPGYTFKQKDNFFYGFKGQSCIPNDILLSQDTNLFIIDSCGELKTNIKIKEYPDDIILHPEELRPNIYGGFIKSSTDPAKHRYAVISVDAASGIAKIIEEYKAIGEINGLMNYHICKYLGPGHVILLLDYKEPNVHASTYSILQEQVDNKVVWQWDSRSVRNSKIKDATLTLRSDGIEALHLNGLDIWDSNHIIVSCRNIGICCLNKESGTFDWVIGQKQNDLNFEHIPLRQHDIKFVDKNKFITFNNNYPRTKFDTRDLLNMTEISSEDYNFETHYCEVLEYDLENYISRCIPTEMPCAPRSGSVSLAKSGIYDINFGQCMKLIGDTIYKFSIYQEFDSNTGEELFNLILPNDRFIIHRGLLKE